MAAPLSFSDTAFTTVNEKMYEGNKPGATTFYGFGVGASISNFRAEAMFSSLNEVNFEYNAPNEKIAGTQLTGNQKIQQKIYGKTLMANFYYDIGNFSNLTPYIGAGIGVAMLDPREYVAENTGQYDVVNGARSNSLAYGIGAGLAYNISDNFIVDLSYMYNDYGAVKNKGSYEYSLPYYTQADGVQNGEMLPEDPKYVGKTKLRAHTIKLGFRMVF